MKEEILNNGMIKLSAPNGVREKGTNTVYSEAIVRVEDKDKWEANE